MFPSIQSTLHERCCHRHARLASGWLAFAGRELNPLDYYERFPSCYISFPSWIYPDAIRLEAGLIDPSVRFGQTTLKLSSSSSGF
jgi:hypothetical protein